VKVNYNKFGKALKKVEFGLNKKQARFLKNSSGKRDVLGVAGSGKTLLLVRKAVREAQAGKRVLLTCYNITMSNYLRDLTNRLSRSKGPHINRNIVVRHYHRIYPKSGGEIIDWEGKFDVILVDEGQDFKQEWIENLYNLAIGKVHFVLVKDDRQNIYKVDAAQQRTQELKLSRSFRIPKATADVANYLIKWAGYDNKSGDITAYPEQKDLFMPIWCSGNPKSVLMTLEKQLSRLVSDPQTGALADIAILVCNVKDGWRICDILDHLKLPYITNFESRDEDEQVRKSFPGEGEKLKHKIEELRRARKIAFWMQAGRIKVCTIHSFKGWELKRVLIYFRPEEEQINTRVPLLYTAITRSQGSLHIYCADTYLEKFGEVAKQHRLVIAPEI
jgi:superfamily I DNA/RNA helicase